MLSDLSLHKSFVRDLQEADEVLFKQYYRKIYIATYAIARNKPIAEDAVQEAFYKALSNLDQLRDKSRFRAWVTRIAINEAKNTLIKQSRHVFCSGVENFLEGTWIWTDRQTDSALNVIEQRDEVKRILSYLKPSDREILVLKYYVDLSIEEIAELLNITSQNVKVRLCRARSSCRNIVHRDSGRQEGTGGGKV